MKLFIIFTTCLLAAANIQSIDQPGADSETDEIDYADVQYSWISDWAEKIMRKLKSHGKGSGKKCFAKKKKGLIPSAKDMDSPLKTFGYPHFNVEARGTVVRAGVPLSYMFGYRQPIKIGSRDYLIAGYPDELLAFFACFENYKVIGSSLNDEGHWIPNTGSIKIQMQNLNDFSKLSSTLFDMVFKYTMDRIIRYLVPTAVIKGLDCKIMGGCDAVKTLAGFQRAIAKIKKWIPGSDKFIAKIIEVYQKDIPLEKKMKEVLDFMRKEEKRKAGIRAEWIGWENVVYSEKKILVTLTMYSKPEHGVRSTHYMKKGTVTMRDIGEALKLAFQKKKL